MKSSEITKIESELAVVKHIHERDSDRLERSKNNRLNKLLIHSSEKRRSDLEKLLHRAKAERAHELIGLRLLGTQMNGSISLRELIKIVEPLNHLLEQSSWKIWDRDGKTDKIDEHFTRLIDLRLAGINYGSTELVITGNTSPDLTGFSALEDGLRNTFSLLAANNEKFVDHVHDLGLPACRALSKLMEVMEKNNIAAEFSWSGPDKKYFWEGRPAEITRIKSVLSDIGEPKTTHEELVGIIQVLSVRNKIEIYCLDTEQKIIANYTHSLTESVNELRLGDRKKFIVEKTVYPLHVAQKKRDAYTLKEIKNFTI